jgi:alpha-tubulin N-acetyltransferase 1
LCAAARTQVHPNVQRLFTQPIVVLNQAALQRAPWGQASREAAEMIQQLGNRSAVAQGLVSNRGTPNPITTPYNLGETNARLYILAQNGMNGAPVAVGLLKVGYKNLFHSDTRGQMTELPNQICVLDFYVHEDYQRGGFGSKLFAAMLQHEGVPPEHFAYDRPSPKLIGFMRKHYGLSEFVPQQNKFVIFQQFFQSAPQKAPSIYDSVKDRPLTARGSRGGIRPR